MPRKYTIHFSRIGESTKHSTPGEAASAWQAANSENLPALIVTNDDGIARIAAQTTTISGPDGTAVYGKSPQNPAL